MQTFQLKVDPDGRVAIPDTHPGEVVTIQVAKTVSAIDDRSGPIPEEDREAIKERILRRARKTRENLPEPWRSADHGDLLYGEDGLPK
jgi:hypothetical protein